MSYFGNPIELFRVDFRFCDYENNNLDRDIDKKYNDIENNIRYNSNFELNSTIESDISFKFKQLPDELCIEITKNIKESNIKDEGIKQKEDIKVLNIKEENKSWWQFW